MTEPTTEPTWGALLRARGRWWKRHLAIRLLFALVFVPVIVLLAEFCEKPIR